MVSFRPLSLPADKQEAQQGQRKEQIAVGVAAPGAPLVQEKQNQTEQQQLLLPKPVSERKMRKIRQGKAGRVRGRGGYVVRGGTGGAVGV